MHINILESGNWNRDLFNITKDCRELKSQRGGGGISNQEIVNDIVAMTIYVCCICMKSLDNVFNWEELILPQNEEEDVELYTDDNNQAREGDRFEIENTNTPSPNDSPGVLDPEFVEDFDEPVSTLPPKRVAPSVGFYDADNNNTNWSAIVATPCGHLYHLGCIHAWMDHLEKRGWEPTCAYCRHVIYNSMELVPIYPVSFKECDTEESDSDCKTKSPHDIKTRGNSHVNCTTKKIIPNQEIARKHTEVKSRYFNCNFWFATLLTLLTLSVYSVYVNNCVQIMDSEDMEDTEMDPLFGVTWVSLLTIALTLAIFADFYADLNHSFVHNPQPELFTGPQTSQSQQLR